MYANQLAERTSNGQQPANLQARGIYRARDATLRSISRKVVAMECRYSSNERTTEVTGNGTRRVTNTKSRKLYFRTSKAKRPRRKAIILRTIIAILVKVALAALKGLLGSGKYHKWFLPESKCKRVILVSRSLA